MSVTSVKLETSAHTTGKEDTTFLNTKLYSIIEIIQRILEILKNELKYSTQSYCKYHAYNHQHCDCGYAPHTVILPD